MKLVRLSIPLITLSVAACGQAVDPMTEEERVRAEAERSADLEAVEKEIRTAGPPLPAEAAAESTALHDEAGAAAGATLETAIGNASSIPRGFAAFPQPSQR